MKAAEHGASDDRSACNARRRDQRRPVDGRRPALADPLVWPRVIEEAAVLVEHLLQVRLVEHEHMVEALTPDGADESLHVAVGRVDLCSVDLRLVIEVKFCKNATRADDIATECRERVLLYREFPKLSDLVFFVYDPEEHLSDPENFEGQLSGDAGWGDEIKFRVTSIVSPRR